jgi:hypothetical protein
MRVHILFLVVGENRTPLPEVGQTLEFLLTQERDKMAIGDYATFLLLLGIN